MDISFYIGMVLLFTFIVVPYFLYAFDKYRVPASLGASVRDNLLLAIGGITGIVLLDAFDPPRDGPHWYMMLGFASAALLRLAFDAYMLRRERLRDAL